MNTENTKSIKKEIRETGNEIFKISNLISLLKKEIELTDLENHTLNEVIDLLTISENKLKTI